jgi:prepilin-type processing-associated H-X9-DG protein
VKGKCGMLYFDGHVGVRTYQDFSQDFSQVRDFGGYTEVSWSLRPFFRGFRIK